MVPGRAARAALRVRRGEDPAVPPGRAARAPCGNWHLFYALYRLHCVMLCLALGVLCMHPRGLADGDSTSSTWPA